MTPTGTQHILLINPNTNVATTARIQGVLEPHLPQGVRLHVRTARFGASYIACEASHAVASHACLDAWAQFRSEDNAPLAGVVVACFGDPGLFALREVSPCTVSGLAEASFILAAQKGSFAIVTGGTRWKPMLTRLAQNLGYEQQLKHIETVEPSGAALQANPEMAIRCLSQACKQAQHYGVQSIILGGAGLAGYAQALQAHVDIPLIDSTLAGLDVVLKQLAPPVSKSKPPPPSGFHATWVNLPEWFAR